MRFSKWLRMVFTAAVVSLCVASIASAGDQDRKRDRKKDGSCQSSYIMEEEAGLTLAALKISDRKKDGSCQSTIEEEKAGFDIPPSKQETAKRMDPAKTKKCSSWLLNNIEPFGPNHIQAQAGV